MEFKCFYPTDGIKGGKSKSEMRWLINYKEAVQ